MKLLLTTRTLNSLLVAFAMATCNSYGQEFSLIADNLHPVGLNLTWSIKAAPNGDVYAQTGVATRNGIARIKGPLEVETVFTATSPDYIVSFPETQTWQPHEPIILENISDYVADAYGNLYVASSVSNKVVGFYASGLVKVLIDANGDKQGNVLEGANSLALGSNGDVYVLSKQAKKLFKIDADGEVTLILDEKGVGAYSFTPRSGIYTNRNREMFIASSDAFFKISFADEPNVHLEKGLDFLIDNAYEDSLALLEIDDFGNVYFVRNSDKNTVYRYSATGGIERILGEEGDGTGEVICAKSGPQEHDPILCEGHGNYLLTIIGLHTDAAQNLFVVGRSSKNVFKVTPANRVSEVAYFSELANFDFQFLRATEMDDTGNLYLLHGKTFGQTDVSLFSFSPMPVENIDDFSLNPPHSDVSHDVSGVTNIPVSYSLTTMAQPQGQQQLFRHLDTRSEVLGSLPWQDGQSRIEYSSSFSSTVTTTLVHEGHTYVAEVEKTYNVRHAVDYLKSIRYSIDSVQVYGLTGLELPYKQYLRYSNQALMAWLYLGNDIINGGPQTDVLYGYDGHDILYGFGGDDLLDGGAGDNIFYGGDGVDTVVYEQKLADYMLSKNPETGFVSVQAKTGYGGYIDQIAPDVERVRFNDFEISTDQITYWGELTPVEILSPSDEPVNVYRFFSARNNAFFYTRNPEEREIVVRNSGANNRAEVDWSFVYQGAKFQTAHSYPGAVPLYRFYNTRTGHHFFTINDAERDDVIDKIANKGWTYVFEGIAFEVYASKPAPEAEENVRPVYRFYSHTLNRHVFTADEKEAQLFGASEDWTSEGIGFYAEALH